MEIIEFKRICDSWLWNFLCEILYIFVVHNDPTFILPLCDFIFGFGFGSLFYLPISRYTCQVEFRRLGLNHGAIEHAGSAYCILIRSTLIHYFVDLVFASLLLRLWLCLLLHLFRLLLFHYLFLFRLLHASLTNILKQTFSLHLLPRLQVSHVPQKCVALLQKIFFYFLNLVFWSWAWGRWRWGLLAAMGIEDILKHGFDVQKISVVGHLYFWLGFSLVDTGHFCVIKVSELS